MGLDVAEDHFYTSALATAAFFERTGALMFCICDWRGRTLQCFI